MVDRHILDTMCQGWRLDVKAVHTDCTSWLLLSQRFFAHMFDKCRIGSRQSTTSSGRHLRSYRTVCTCHCRDVAVWVLAAHFRQHAFRISLVFFRRRISSGVKSINFLVRNFLPLSHLAQAIRTSSSQMEQNPDGVAGKLLQNAHGSVAFEEGSCRGEPSLSTQCLHKRSMPSDKITNHSSGSHLVTNSRKGNNLSGREPFGLQPRQYNIMSGLRFFLGASLENFFSASGKVMFPR